LDIEASDSVSEVSEVSFDPESECIDILEGMKSDKIKSKDSMILLVSMEIDEVGEPTGEGRDELDESESERSSISSETAWRKCRRWVEL
jgi:hypothetical protein